MGGKSSSSSAQTTNNQDNRIAVQDGIGVGAGGTFFAQDSSTKIDGRSWDLSNRSTNTDARTFSDARTFDYSDESTTTINTLDGGAIAAAFGFGNNTVSGAMGFGNNTVSNALGFANSANNRAMDAIELSNVTVSAGFTQLLDVAEGLFSKSEGLIGQTQQAVADAYGQAQTDAKGTIDNRTITVLAVAGVAALFLLNRK
jgi:hypothetical protein